jgi:hypothetical protein
LKTAPDLLVIKSLIVLPGSNGNKQTDKQNMRKSILKLGLLSWLTLAVVAPQGRVMAQDNQNQKPVSEQTEANDKKSGALPFHGRLKAVDHSARTITVGALTLQITADTKMTKAGKPAVLEDATVGEDVGGAYKKTEDGKLNVTKVRFGPKENKSSGKDMTKAEQ